MRGTLAERQPFVYLSEMDQERRYFLTPTEYRARLESAGLEVADITLSRWTFAGYITPPIGPKHKARYCLESVGDVGALVALWEVIGARQPSGATMRALEFVRAQSRRPDAIRDSTDEMDAPRMRWTRPPEKKGDWRTIFELERGLIGGNQTIHIGALTALCAYWKAIGGINIKAKSYIVQVWSGVLNSNGRENGTFIGVFVHESRYEKNFFDVNYLGNEAIREQKISSTPRSVFIKYPLDIESIEMNCILKQEGMAHDHA